MTARDRARLAAAAITLAGCAALGGCELLIGLGDRQLASTTGSGGRGGSSAGSGGSGGEGGSSAGSGGSGGQGGSSAGNGGSGG